MLAKSLSITINNDFFNRMFYKLIRDGFEDEA